PALGLSQRDRVLRRRLAPLDVEERSLRGLLGPDVFAEPADRVDDGFVEALRLDLDAVADAAAILKAHGAHANRHGGESLALSSFVRLRRTGRIPLRNQPDTSARWPLSRR